MIDTIGNVNMAAKWPQYNYLLFPPIRCTLFVVTDALKLIECMAKQTIEVVKLCVQPTGYSPSVRELQGRLPASTSSRRVRTCTDTTNTLERDKHVDRLHESTYAWQQIVARTGNIGFPDPGHTGSRVGTRSNRGTFRVSLPRICSTRKKDVGLYFFSCTSHM